MSTIRSPGSNSASGRNRSRPAGGSRFKATSRLEEIAALDFCAFQLGTVRDYMEPPGSAELAEAYRRYVHEPDVDR
jgi:hypothetical protein